MLWDYISVKTFYNSTVETEAWKLQLFHLHLPYYSLLIQF